jgi:hypothetical protein
MSERLLLSLQTLRFEAVKKFHLKPIVDDAIGQSAGVKKSVMS